MKFTSIPKSKFKIELKSLILAQIERWRLLIFKELRCCLLTVLRLLFDLQRRRSEISEDQDSDIFF